MWIRPPPAPPCPGRPPLASPCWLSSTPSPPASPPADPAIPSLSMPAASVAALPRPRSAVVDLASLRSRPSPSLHASPPCAGPPHMADGISVDHGLLSSQLSTDQAASHMNGKVLLLKLHSRALLPHLLDYLRMLLAKQMRHLYGHGYLLHGYAVMIAKSGAAYQLNCQISFEKADGFQSVLCSDSEYRI